MTDAIRDDVEIHKHAFYKHHVRNAESWRDGRVMLVGDAAHLMPPWAGQGMQSGVRDAFNLSWKLAGVLDGSLPESILDTYQPEGAPNVEFYTRFSVELGRVMKQEFTDEEKHAMQLHTDEPPPSLPVVAPVMSQAGLSATRAAIRLSANLCRSRGWLPSTAE